MLYVYVCHSSSLQNPANHTVQPSRIRTRTQISIEYAYDISAGALLYMYISIYEEMDIGIPFGVWFFLRGGTERVFCVRVCVDLCSQPTARTSLCV